MNTTANMTAEQAAAHAAGYRSAANNAAELLSLHGADATSDMLTLGLTANAERWETIAAHRADVTVVGEHHNYAAMRRIVAAWIVESNNGGGIDADDLMFRLEQAGVGLAYELDRAERGDYNEDDGD